MGVTHEAGFDYSVNEHLWTEMFLLDVLPLTMIRRNWETNYR